MGDDKRGETHDTALLKSMVDRGLITPELAEQAMSRSQPDASAVDLLIQEGYLTKHIVETLLADTKDPTAIADFKILGKLGQGGMATVYKAVQLRMHREVALKVIDPQFAINKEFCERFIREARVAGQINHPNVITCHDVGQDKGYLYMALELVTGGDAAQVAQQDGGRLSEARALRVLIDAVRGLAALTRAGLIHRDIKPANIFITEDGVAKLADLGLARPSEDSERMTNAGMPVGTPAYMSPEQAAGEEAIDCRSDIYALGATLFALLTGQSPFAGPNALAVLAQVQKDPTPDPRKLTPQVSDAAAAIIAKAMSKARHDRYQTPDDLLEDLRLAAAGRPLRHAAIIPTSRWPAKRDATSRLAAAANATPIGVPMSPQMAASIAAPMGAPAQPQVIAPASMDAQTLAADLAADTTPRPRRTVDWTRRVSSTMAGQHRADHERHQWMPWLVISLSGGALAAALILTLGPWTGGGDRARTTEVAPVVALDAPPSRSPTAPAPGAGSAQPSRPAPSPVSPASAPTPPTAVPVVAVNADEQVDIDAALAEPASSARVRVVPQLTPALTLADEPTVVASSPAAAPIVPAPQPAAVAAPTATPPPQPAQPASTVTPPAQAAQPAVAVAAPTPPAVDTPAPVTAPAVEPDAAPAPDALALAAAERERDAAAARERDAAAAQERDAAAARDLAERERRAAADREAAERLARLPTPQEAAATTWQLYLDKQGLKATVRATATGIEVVNVARETRDLAPLLAVPMEHLDLSGCERLDDDLAPLGGKPSANLRSLDLTGCRRLKSLDGIGHAKLQRLSLKDCAALNGDLEPLSGMPITSLELSGCASLDSINGVQRMPLTTLDLSECRSVGGDLGALRGMRLTTLSLAGCENLESLRGIEGMPLQSIDLRGCSSLEGDLSALSGMPLTRINLIGCESLEGLDGIQGLKPTELNLTGCRALSGDLRALKGMQLKRLYLTDCRSLVSLDGLQGMPLTELDLTNCESLEGDLSPLKGLQLTRLSIAGCKHLSSLNGLQGMPLKELDMAYCATVQPDLAPLAGAPLTQLNLTRCSSLVSLRGIERAPLKRIVLTRTGGLEDQTALATMKNVEIER